MSVRKVSVDFLSDVLESKYTSKSGKCEPIGMYYCEDYDCYGTLCFIGMNNKEGMAVTREFDDYRQCMRFLFGGNYTTKSGKTEMGSRCVIM